MPDIWTVSGVGINLSGNKCVFQGTIDFESFFLSGGLNSGVIDPPPVQPPGFAFDMGVGQVAPPSGFLKVTQSKTYTSGSYGWMGANYDARDRGQPSGLMQDFVFAQNMTFRLDGLASGNYQAKLSFCDAFAPHDMAVSVQGAFQDNVIAPIATPLTKTYPFAATGGFLTVGINGSGGVDPNAILNALEVTRI